jgi:hypothetical protein
MLRFSAGDVATVLVILGESLGKADRNGVKSARMQAMAAMRIATLMKEDDEPWVCERA